MTVQEFWNDFLKETKRDLKTQYYECFHFSFTKEIANSLLDLVLSGQKLATSSSLYCYELTQFPLPQVGNLSIVTDWDGHPRCVIKTTAVTIIPFRDITFDICKREGEDDTLESWQKSHREAFKEDAQELGFTFTEDMPVVFLDFQVVYKV